MQIPGVGFGAVVGLSGEFDLELPLCDLFPQVEGERSPHDRLAGRILFDLAPQFQELLLSTFGLFEVSPQAEFVLDQLSIATMLPADLTGVFALAVQLPMLPITCRHAITPLSRIVIGDDCPIEHDTQVIGLLASRNRTFLCDLSDYFDNVPEIQSRNGTSMRSRKSK